METNLLYYLLNKTIEKRALYNDLYTLYNIATYYYANIIDCMSRIQREGEMELSLAGMKITPKTRIAFFDAEYTAKNNTDKGIQEMIQCAMYIAEYNENKTWSTIDEYVTFVKPMYVPQLSDFIIEFTGIQQSDVDNAKTFVTVINELYELIKTYNVSTICVWGPDKSILKYNMELTQSPFKRSRMLLSKIEDVSEMVSKSLGLNYILSQTHACQELEIEPIGKQHDAACDAQTLQQIMFKYFNQQKKQQEDNHDIYNYCNYRITSTHCP